VSKPYKPYLDLIYSALDAIASYQPETWEAFQKSPMAQDAILMRLQEIGENMAHIRHLNEERFIELGQDSWHRFIGLRNIISHGYHRIRTDQIWQIITDELPPFRASLTVLDLDDG
jgi:uncharacterized protein with HEPN domain